MRMRHSDKTSHLIVQFLLFPSGDELEQTEVDHMIEDGKLAICSRSAPKLIDFDRQIIGH